MYRALSLRLLVIGSLGLSVGEAHAQYGPAHYRLTQQTAMQQAAYQRVAIQQAVLQHAYRQAAYQRQMAYQQQMAYQLMAYQQMAQLAAYQNRNSMIRPTPPAVSHTTSPKLNVGVYYKPPGLPITVRYGSDGISIHASKEVVTPIGTFGVDGGLNKP